MALATVKLAEKVDAHKMSLGKAILRRTVGRIVKAAKEKIGRKKEKIVKVEFKDVGTILVDIGIAVVVFAFAYLIGTAATNGSTPSWLSNMFNSIGRYLPFIVLGLVMVLVIRSFKK